MYVCGTFLEGFLRDILLGKFNSWSKFSQFIINMQYEELVDHGKLNMLKKTEIFQIFSVVSVQHHEDNNGIIN